MHTDLTIAETLKTYNANLQNFVKHCYGHNRVTIFGTGSYAQRIAKILKRHDIKIEYFFDNDRTKSNLKIDNIPILHPTEHQDALEHLPIIVASTWHADIIAQLSKINSNLHIINASDFDYEMNIHFLDEKEQENILWFYQQLQDQDSQKLLLSLLRYRSTGVFKYLPKSSFPQYLHPNLSLTDEETMIDGGAWQGDTAEFFLDNFEEMHIISLEPDPKNYKVLQTLKNRYKERFLPLQYGLWNKNTTLYFKSTDVMGDKQSIGCLINDQGDIKIKVKSLDTIVSQLKITPSYIKMDIEGAEYEAILGAAQTIQRYKPKLAICLYHKPEDLWQLPKLIHEIRDDYTFYLGHHFCGWTETVLYAL